MLTAVKKIGFRSKARIKLLSQSQFVDVGIIINNYRLTIKIDI